MISTLKKVINEHKEWLYSADSDLSFMKTSTPASGRKPNHGKVLIFVFEDGKDMPSLCIKTSRTYAGGEEIRRNYSNLKLLSGSMFANALYLHDDGKLIFSVESVCPGHKFSAKGKGVDSVVDTYISWQKSLAHHVQTFLYKDDLKKITFDTIDILNISEEAKDGLKNYYEKLPSDDRVKLPELVQHGDLTPDNVLISGSKVSFIDYDYVGFSKVPGFDLFHFLSKSKSLDSKYFSDYFKKIDAVIESYDHIFFLYYIQESLRKSTGHKKDAKDIVQDFESLIAKQ